MRRLKFLLVLLLSVGLFAFSAWRFPVPLHGGLILARAFAADLALALAALAVGRRFLVRLKLYHASLSEEGLFSLSLGLVVFSLLGSALGALGGLYAWVAWLCVGLVLLTQWDHLEHFSRDFQRNLRVKHPWDGSSGEVLALVAGTLGLLGALGLCLAPVTFYDALSYHLAGVQSAVQSGQDLPQANNLFTWLPDLAQPLWIFAVLLSGNGAGSTVAPALLNAGLALVLGLALVEASGRWLSERKLWLAPALAWTQPVMVLSFGVFSPDPWMAFFAFQSLFAFLAAMDERDFPRQRTWLALAALLAGAACAAKPVALLHVAALGGLWIWQAWEQPLWRRPRWVLGGMALLLIPLAPWFLRGAILAGDPIYPFGLRAFGHVLWQGAPDTYFRAMDSFGRESWRLPWALFFDTGSLGGGGHLSWLLLALVPAAWAWRYSPTQRALTVYGALSLALWCLGPHVLRYLLFALPAACLLAAHGALEVEAWAASKSWSLAWRALVLAGLFLGAGQTLLIVTKDFRPWEAALGLQDAADYLSERGVPQAEAAQWILSRHKPRTRVLVLGDARTAYLAPPALAASPYEEHPFKAWAAQAASPQDLGAIVRRKGYDFVLFSRAEWARVEDPARPFYWAHDDAAGAERVRTWLESLIVERPHLELKRGAGWVIDLR